MPPTLLSSHFSSSMNFWYLSGMGCGLNAKGGLMVGMPILNRLVLPTFVDACFVTVRKAYVELSEELDLPLVILITYFGYLVQDDSLTAAV